MTGRKRGSTLMVIILDVLSDLIKKGEVTDRYYNPGDLFDEVHLVLVNEDRPDPTATQKMVGRAKLHIHSLPPPNFFASLGWNPALCGQWSKRLVALAQAIRPDLIRCHSSGINSWGASKIREVLGVPYVVSLHINPDDDLLFHAVKERRWKRIAKLKLMDPVEAAGLKGADLVVCVYEFIVKYAKRVGSRRIRVLYNATNPSTVVPKEDYRTGEKFKAVIVGRQFEQKDPAPLIRAIARLQNIELTLIGNGPIHDGLVSLARELGVSDRCVFHKSMPNDVLCARLHQYDAFFSINDFGGISKSEIEAARVGLPIVTNEHPLEAKPELVGDTCLTVAGSEESYRRALETLMGDVALREKLGRGAREAMRPLDPAFIESEWVAIYRQLMAEAVHTHDGVQAG